MDASKLEHEFICRAYEKHMKEIGFPNPKSEWLEIPPLTRYERFLRSFDGHLSFKPEIVKQYIISERGVDYLVRNGIRFAPGAIVHENLPF